MIQFVFNLLFQVNKDDAAVLVHHGLIAVGLHVDDKRATFQVIKFALQTLNLGTKAVVLALQTACLGLCCNTCGMSRRLG